MKLIKVLSITLLIVSFSLIAAPKPANAFTLFGIRFFEKAPTPTPTPKVTVTPTPKATATPTPAVEGATSDNLPSTGPAESVGLLLSVVVGGFIARKFLQTS